jgi:hypothetical protein
MRKFAALILGLVLSAVFTLPAWAGTMTSNKFLYKPNLGARGAIDKKDFDAGLDRLDARLAKEIWLGDPNYGPTIQDAITAIGSSQVILRIPAGAHVVTSQFISPANITIKFEDGAYLDLTGLLDAPIEAWTRANPSQVTITGHGLSNGTYVRFYNVRQYATSGSTCYRDWNYFDNYLYQATSTGANTFTVPADTSTYHAAYDSATDPGRVCVPIIIKGQVIANKKQIFKTAAGSAQVVLGTTITERLSSPQADFYPEWFGAVADRTTDCINALDTARYAMSVGYLLKGTLHLSGIYYISSTFSLNNFGLNYYMFNIVGTDRKNSGFFGGFAGKPVLELLGCYGPTLKHFGIWGYSGGGEANFAAAGNGTRPATAPTVAILLARSINTNSGSGWVEDLGLWGAYQYGAVYNFGHDTTTWTNIEHQATSTTDNLYAFNAFVGDGTGGQANNPFPGVVPANADFNYWSVNCQGNANRLNNAWFYTFPSTVKAAGNADLYLWKSGLVCDGVASGGSYDYVVYAYKSSGTFYNFGGDGGGDVAGMYLCTDGTMNYPKVLVRNFTQKRSTPLIKADANTIPYYSDFDELAGDGDSGFSLEFANGPQFCRFTNLRKMFAFKSLGNLIGCHVELPDSCKNFSIPTTSYNNNIRWLATGSNMYGNTYHGLSSDLRIGVPGVANIPSLYLEPHRLTWAYASPTTGSWSRGSVIWNASAASGQPMGWQCVNHTSLGADGTGTLNSGNTTGALANAAKRLVVNSLTGLSIGDWLMVAGVSVCPLRVVGIATEAKPIEGLSRANPCVVTCAAHGLPNNATVAFSGITQTGWTGVNGNRQITVIDANSFSIPVDTSAYAAAYAPATDPGIHTALVVTLSGNSNADVGPTAAVTYRYVAAASAFRAMANLP